MGSHVESEVRRMLDVTTPQHIALFRAAGEQAREPTLPPPAEPDMELMAAAGRFKIDVLGPLPR